MFLNITAIALGAALGANLRYALSLWAAAHFAGAFPYGTLLINLTGSLLIGVILGLAATRWPLSEPLRLLLVTGLLGGFTTFSSFSFELYTLLVQGRWLVGGLYVLASVGLGLLATAFGFGLVQRF